MERFQVEIGGDELIFSAAHFITFEDGQCEPLHGHDYQLRIEVEGGLGGQGYVVDFLAVRRLARQIIQPLDHHVLLPLEHPAIAVHDGADEVEVRWATRRWQLPRGDCALLPLAHTTSELLARWIGRQLDQRLRAELAFEAELIRVRLGEMNAQAAIWEYRRVPGDC